MMRRQPLSFCVALFVFVTVRCRGLNRNRRMKSSYVVQFMCEFLVWQH